MKQKRGQFFLLAAVILISLLAGIFIYSNQVYIQDSRDGVKILSAEVQDETNMVINFGLYSTEDKLEDFISEMSTSLLQRDSSVELLFFYNDDSNIAVLNLADETINLKVGEDYRDITSEKNTESIDIADGSIGGFNNLVITSDMTKRIPLSDFEIDSQTPDQLIFKVENISYDLPWAGEKRFYFLIKRIVGEETYVSYE